MQSKVQNCDYSFTILHLPDLLHPPHVVFFIRSILCPLGNFLRNFLSQNRIDQIYQAIGVCIQTALACPQFMTSGWRKLFQLQGCVLESMVVIVALQLGEPVSYSWNNIHQVMESFGTKFVTQIGFRVFGFRTFRIQIFRFNLGASREIVIINSTSTPVFFFRWRFVVSNSWGTRRKIIPNVWSLGEF